MAGKSPQTDRRADALSKDRIVKVAIEILDVEGATGLTFRSLASRLKTGSGAIYWHVQDKTTLLAAATDYIVAEAVTRDVGSGSPQEAIRTLALGVFDAVDAHPWVGEQLSSHPWQYSVLRILERLGTQVTALGLPEQARFNAATALLSFILGLAGQYAVGSRHFAADMDRTAFLRSVAAQWTQLDPTQHPFVRQVAAHLPDHDDREQFMAGIEFILAGIESAR